MHMPYSQQVLKQLLHFFNAPTSYHVCRMMSGVYAMRPSSEQLHNGWGQSSSGAEALLVQCWLRAELSELSSHQCTVLMYGQLSKWIRLVNKPAEMEWIEISVCYIQKIKQPANHKSPFKKYSHFKYNWPACPRLPVIQSLFALGSSGGVLTVLSNVATVILQVCTYL